MWKKTIVFANIPDLGNISPHEVAHDRLVLDVPLSCLVHSLLNVLNTETIKNWITNPYWLEGLLFWLAHLFSNILKMNNIMYLQKDTSLAETIATQPGENVEKRLWGGDDVKRRRHCSSFLNIKIKIDTNKDQEREVCSVNSQWVLPIVFPKWSSSGPDHQTVPK